MLWLIAALALAALLAVAYRRLGKIAPIPLYLNRLHRRGSFVPWLLEQRFEEKFWLYRQFGFRLLTVLYLPLRRDLKALCSGGSWLGLGLLAAFDGLYLLLWLKGAVFGNPHDLRVVLGLHLVAVRRIGEAVRS